MAATDIKVFGTKAARLSLFAAEVAARLVGARSKPFESLGRTGSDGTLIAAAFGLRPTSSDNIKGAVPSFLIVKT